MTSRHRIIDSPIGPLTLVGEGDVLTGLYFPGHWTRPDPSAWGPADDESLTTAAHQLGEYLAGERTAFALRLRLRGTAFQRAVWTRLAAIPHGTTTTYRELAVALGRPGHARAVGAAVRTNPISVIVPCHRVLGSSGGLTGYAGGLERKAFTTRWVCRTASWPTAGTWRSVSARPRGGSRRPATGFRTRSCALTFPKPPEVSRLIR